MTADPSSAEGAKRLARAIESFWAARGYPSVVAAPAPVHLDKAGDGQRYFGVTSNLVRGLPPDWGRAQR